MRSGVGSEPIVNELIFEEREPPVRPSPSAKANVEIMKANGNIMDTNRKA